MLILINTMVHHVRSLYTTEHIVMFTILHFCQHIPLNITHCTFKLFQTCMNLFFLLNTKDSLKNMDNQTVDIMGKKYY